jgi:hypothetical protein
VARSVFVSFLLAPQEVRLPLGSMELQLRPPSPSALAAMPHKIHALAEATRTETLCLRMPCSVAVSGLFPNVCPIEAPEIYL